MTFRQKSTINTYFVKGSIEVAESKIISTAIVSTGNYGTFCEQKLYLVKKCFLKTVFSSETFYLSKIQQVEMLQLQVKLQSRFYSYK